MHSRIHLSHPRSTLVSDKAELIDESLAGLTAVVVDGVGRNGRGGVLVGKGL